MNDSVQSYLEQVELEASEQPEMKLLVVVTVIFIVVLISETATKYNVLRDIVLSSQTAIKFSPNAVSNFWYNIVS